MCDPHVDAMLSGGLPSWVDEQYAELRARTALKTSRGSGDDSDDVDEFVPLDEDEDPFVSDVETEPEDEDLADIDVAPAGMHCRDAAVCADRARLALRIGDRVVALGLVARPELNGVSGTIVALDVSMVEEELRHAVVMANAEGVRVKAANLKLAPPLKPSLRATTPPPVTARGTSDPASPRTHEKLRRRRSSLPPRAASAQAERDGITRRVSFQVNPLDAQGACEGGAKNDATERTAKKCTLGRPRRSHAKPQPRVSEDDEDLISWRDGKLGGTDGTGCQSDMGEPARLRDERLELWQLGRARGISGGVLGGECFSYENESCYELAGYNYRGKPPAETEVCLTPAGQGPWRNMTKANLMDVIASLARASLVNEMDN